MVNAVYFKGDKRKMYKTELDWVSAYKKLEVELENKDKRIAELEAENAELKDLLQRKEMLLTSAEITAHNEGADKIALLKENAELKEQLESERDLPAIAYMQGAEKQKKKDEDQLTKAKEIIRELIELATWQGSNCPSFKSVQNKAEQFLNENSTYERIQKAKYNYTD